jgi:hypothetical protein
MLTKQMPDRRPLGLLVVALALTLGFGVSHSRPSVTRDIILHVEQAPNAWADAGLDRELREQFTRDQTVRIITVNPADTMLPPFPNARYDIDSLRNWGQEVGGRYLLSIVVHDERLERRKSFHLPLVFHKWEVVGVIEGEMRLLDISRGRLLVARPFKSELSGKRVFQATMDDHKYDPDIHMTAKQKMVFFNQLEAQAAGDLITLVSRHTRTNGNGY